MFDDLDKAEAGFNIEHEGEVYENTALTKLTK